MAISWLLLHARTSPPLGDHFKAKGARSPPAVVLINFGVQEGTLNVPFLRGGRWAEQLNDADNEAPETLEWVAGQTEATVSIPSNYGKVFVSG